MTSSIPLVLDVDGTLIRNDLTHELLLKGICHHPHKIFKIFALGLKSKSKMKAYLISLVGDDIDVENLPYIDAVIETGRHAHAEGRDVILCSGSYKNFIAQIFDHFPWVSDYHSTCLLYTSPSPRDATLSRMPSSA